jgi:hypothetical protein
MQWINRSVSGLFAMLIASCWLLVLTGWWLFISSGFPKGQMYSTLFLCGGFLAAFLVAWCVLIMQNRFPSTSEKIIAVAIAV